MPNGDLTFLRILFPFGNRIADQLVELEQSILDGEHCQHAGKAFRTASEHMRGFFPPVVVTLVENFASMLDQNAMTTEFLGVISRLFE